jgi:hypothetical protein
MARNLTVRLVDDLDGGEAAETVAFGVDGSWYEIDLSVAHAGQLRGALAEFIAAGRRTAARRGRPRKVSVAAVVAPAKKAPAKKAPAKKAPAKKAPAKKAPAKKAASTRRR